MEPRASGSEVTPGPGPSGTPVRPEDLAPSSGAEPSEESLTPETMPTTRPDLGAASTERTAATADDGAEDRAEDGPAIELGSLMWSTRVRAGARASDFLGSLAVLSEADAPGDGVSDDGVWEDVAGSAPPRVPATEGGLFWGDVNLPLQIEDILRRPLVHDGKPVAEFKTDSKRARRLVAYAACKDGRPAVFYGSRLPGEISDFALVFIREHEMAHHVERDVDCEKGTTKYPLSKGAELAADCRAARRLLAFKGGSDVLKVVYGTFYGMNRRATGHYPSTVERANQLDQCVREAQTSAA